MPPIADQIDSGQYRGVGDALGRVNVVPERSVIGSGDVVSRMDLTNQMLSLASLATRRAQQRTRYVPIGKRQQRRLRTHVLLHLNSQSSNDSTSLHDRPGPGLADQVPPDLAHTS
jgi:hypothetical protein